MSEQKRIALPFTIIKNYRTTSLLQQKTNQRSVQNVKKTRPIKKRKLDLLSIQQTGTKSQQIDEDAQLEPNIEPFLLVTKLNFSKNNLREDFQKKQFFDQDDLQMGIPFYGRLQELDRESHFPTMKKLKLEQTRENLMQDDQYLWNNEFIF